MTRSANCVCGQLSVNVTGEPERVNMCNCSACQRRSGSAFQIGAWFRDERVTAINGERRVYKRLAAEGRSVDLYFCPTCGVSVYARADLRPGWTLLHGGSLTLIFRNQLTCCSRATATNGCNSHPRRTSSMAQPIPKPGAWIRDWTLSCWNLGCLAARSSETYKPRDECALSTSNTDCDPVN